MADPSEHEQPSRLERQAAFLAEAERLKLVYRRNRTVDRSRFENSAEHSWHAALTALILAEHADAEGIDMAKVLSMLLIHDLVEIDAGDTWLYDAAGAGDQPERERVAADRIFGLLPDDQGRRLRALWEEFDTRSTPEGAFAAAIDLLQPLANHLLSGGFAGDEPKPAVEQVLERKRGIADGSAELWRLARRIIEESTEKGFYRQ